MRRFEVMGPLFIGAVAGIGLLLSSQSASAEGFDSCGNIEVSASAECKAEFSGGCKANCTPVHFELACEGQCDGECSAQIDASCTATCSADCSAKCEVNPGSFDCQADCSARCDGDCSAHCEASGGGSSCQADCKASCRGECKGHCNVDPPSGNCQAQCDASCKGNCEFNANAQCDINCNASCSSELTGGCNVQCDKPEGSVYCDGEYIDAGNNAAECFDAIEAALDIDGYASASAECNDEGCEAEAAAGCDCGQSSIANSKLNQVSSLAAFAAGLGLLISRRRKNKKS